MACCFGIPRAPCVYTHSAGMYTSRNSYSSRTPSSPTSIRTRRRTGTSARQPRRPARSRRPTRASGRALQAGCQLASRRGAMRQLHLEAARSGGARRARRRRAASGHERRRWLRGQRRKEMRVERKPLLRRWFTRSGKIDAYDGRSAPAKLCSSRNIHGSIVSCRRWPPLSRNRPCYTSVVAA